MKIQRPLGENQIYVLKSMTTTSNAWWPGCGWLWDNYSSTVRLMRSLEKRGLVTESAYHGSVRFDLTEDWEILARALGYH